MAAQRTLHDIKPVDAAQALVPVMGSSLGRIIFDLGPRSKSRAAWWTRSRSCGVGRPRQQPGSRLPNRNSAPSETERT